jgi:hypothetical protein
VASRKLSVVEDGERDKRLGVGVIIKKFFVLTASIKRLEF